MTISQSLTSRIRAYFAKTGADHRATADDIHKAMPDVDVTRIAMVLSDLFRQTGEFDRVKITNPRHGDGTQRKSVYTYWRIDGRRPAPLKPQKAPPRRHELQQQHAQPEVAQNTGSQASDSLATPSSAEGLAVAQEPPTPDKAPAAACSDEMIPPFMPFNMASPPGEKQLLEHGFSFFVTARRVLHIVPPSGVERAITVPAEAVRELAAFLDDIAWT